MVYVKGILSGFAAFFIALCVFLVNFWWIKGYWTGYGCSLLMENIFSPLFWVVGLLLFWLFFAGSRGTATLRVLFFWIPTLVVSALL
jgi:hypothetical protein